MNDLTELLYKVKIFQSRIKPIEESITIIDLNQLKELFESYLGDVLIKSKNIGIDFFLCSNYIVTLLKELQNKEIKSWFVIDYILEGTNKSYSFKNGADICFLICSLFPDRTNIRSMRQKDYEIMGEGLYYNYYYMTGNEIGFYMSNRFIPMVNLTKQAFQNIKNK